MFQGQTNETRWPWADDGGYRPAHAARLDRRSVLGWSRVTYLALWAKAFAFTLGSELALAPWLLPPEEPLWRRAATVVAANVLSHPAVWFVFPELGMTYTPMLICAELWAVGSELVLYRLVFPRLRWRRALAVSTLANALSMSAGLAVRGLGFSI